MLFIRVIKYSFKIVLSLLLLIILLELGSRFIVLITLNNFFNKYLPDSYESIAVQAQNDTYSFLKSSTLPDSQCYYIWKNGFFRGPTGQFDIYGKESDEIRVMCVGDSTTFGVCVDYYWSYPTILERLLKAKYPESNIGVLNTGIPGASSKQIKRVFQKYLVKYKPDIVVWRTGVRLTDHYDLPQSLENPINNLLWNILSKSTLFRLICLFVDRVIPDKPPVDHTLYSYLIERNTTLEPCGNFDSNFAIVNDIARSNGTKYVLAVDYLRRDLDGSQNITSDFDDYPDKDVPPVVNTYETFKEILMDVDINDVFVDECHLTRLGTSVIANAVAEHITTNGWIDSFTNKHPDG